MLAHLKTVLLQGGRVVERGEHHELLQKGEVYKRLVRAQVHRVSCVALEKVERRTAQCDECYKHGVLHIYLMADDIV